VPQQLLLQQQGCSAAVPDLLLLPVLHLLHLLQLLVLLVLNQVVGFWLQAAASRKACGLRSCLLAHQKGLLLLHQRVKYFSSSSRACSRV
jgi:hypothetical protein